LELINGVTRWRYPNRSRYFEIGGIVLRNLTAALAKSGIGDEAHPEDGLLPVRLFHGIYFNNVEEQVVLNPVFGTMSPISQNY
jgi:hypothetical protein